MTTFTTVLQRGRGRPAGAVLRAAGFVALAFVVVAVAAALVCLAANASVLNEAVPSTPDAAPASGAYVTLQSDERLFTLMAALNAAGYDDENNPEGMSPVRQTVRAKLASESIPSLARLRLQFKLHPSLYVAYVLQRGDPPDFARLVPGWWVEAAPPFLFYGLDGSLRDFYQEAGIAGLWQENKPQYEAEAERYRSVVSPAVAQVLSYLRVKDPPTGRVVVLPNLLDAYWRGYGPRVGNTSYVVVGPSDEPNIGLVQHEAMHPIINPLVDANLDVIDPEQTSYLYAHLRSLVPPGYPTWDGILRESVIRALEVRILDPARRPALLAQEESQGFMIVRPLAAELANYEKSRLTFAEYLPTLLRSLNSFSLNRP